MANALKERERQLADQSYVSSLAGEAALGLIQFPKDVRGKRILDIGSGASNTVKRLNDMGAEAYGLDCRYKNPRDLEQSLRKYAAKAQGKYNRQVKSGDLTGLVGVDKADMKMYDRNADRAAQEFWEDFRRNKARYIHGWAGSIPFPDNHFDFVYSVEAVSRFMAKDRDVLRQVITEALRVLKPTGEFQMHPWMGSLYGLQYWTPDEVTNLDEVSSEFGIWGLTRFTIGIGSGALQASPLMVMVKT